jgi:hypothetical protein
MERSIHAIIVFYMQKEEAMRKPEKLHISHQKRHFAHPMRNA